jgi:hypothetical protein
MIQLSTMASLSFVVSLIVIVTSDAASFKRIKY